MYDRLKSEYPLYTGYVHNMVPVRASTLSDPAGRIRPRFPPRTARPSRRSCCCRYSFRHRRWRSGCARCTSCHRWWWRSLTVLYSKRKRGSRPRSPPPPTCPRKLGNPVSPPKGKAIVESSMGGRQKSGASVMRGAMTGGGSRTAGRQSGATVHTYRRISFFVYQSQTSRKVARIPLPPSRTLHNSDHFER